MTTILLIDLSSIARPIFERTSTNTDPDRVSIEIVQRVRALSSGQPHVAICCDSGRSFRHDLDPTYKANRGEVNASYGHQVTLAREALVADGFPVWAVKGFEADDLLASATVQAVNGRSQWAPDGCTVLIATSDKDMFQLVSDRVSVHRVADTKKATTVTPEVVREEFGVEPNQLTEWLMLVGDSSDNIIGAHDIGKKRASAMLTKYGNLSDLYAALDTAIKKNDPKAFLPSTVQSLLEFRPRIEAVRALVTLRTDVPLPFEEVFRERVPVDVAAFGEDDSMTQESHAVDGDTGGIPRTEAIPSAAAGSSQDETPRRNERIEQPAVPALDGTKVGVETQKPRAGSEPADSRQSLAVRDAEVLPPPSTDVRWQLEPRSMSQAREHAKFLFESRIFSQFGTAQAIYAIVTRGRELGIPSVAALMAFHNIDNKPCPSADTMQSLVNTSGKVKFFRCKERTPTRATFVTQRNEDDEPTSLTYTIEEAQASWKKSKQAWESSNWGNVGSSADMCVARAKAKLCRLVCPEAVLGLYAPEEFD